MFNWLSGRIRTITANWQARKTALEAAQEAAAERRRKAREAAERRRERERQTILRRARALMSQPFVIADLETTGFSSADEILELAAIRVSPEGRVIERFSRLVRINGCITSRITELTGITQTLVRQQGVRLDEALEDFLDFCGYAPVFFHNASFDMRFLRAAAAKTGLELRIRAYCSVRVARAAWPELRSHSLEKLAALVDAPRPTHRGLDDVQTTLHVLMAAIAPKLRSAA